jgi:hypothetical protein
MLIYFLTFLTIYKKIKKLETPNNILEVIIEINIKEYYNNNKKPY